MPSRSMASCSSSAIGAERWEMPTTRTLTRGPHGVVRRRSAAGETENVAGCSCGLRGGLGDGGLALLVVGEDLQLLGQVDLADRDVIADGEHGRREVQDAG